MPFLGPKGLSLKPVKTGNDFADAILSLVLPMTLEEQVTGLASPMSFLGMAGKKFLPGINKIAKERFFAAPSDAKPLSSLEKLFPALINEKTGEVMVNMQRGPGGHETLLKSLQGMTGKATDWVRGFADEVTGFGFTEKQLNKFF